MHDVTKLCTVAINDCKEHVSNGYSHECTKCFDGFYLEDERCYSGSIARCL